MSTISAASSVNYSAMMPQAAKSNAEPTPEEDKKNFDSALRQDATELSKVELEGNKNLALVEGTVGSLINVKA